MHQRGGGWLINQQPITTPLKMHDSTAQPVRSGLFRKSPCLDGAARDRKSAAAGRWRGFYLTRAMMMEIKQKCKMCRSTSFLYPHQSRIIISLCHDIMLCLKMWHCHICIVMNFKYKKNVFSHFYWRGCWRSPVTVHRAGDSWATGTEFWSQLNLLLHLKVVLKVGSIKSEWLKRILWRTKDEMVNIRCTFEGLPHSFIGEICLHHLHNTDNDDILEI